MKSSISKSAYLGWLAGALAAKSEGTITATRAQNLVLGYATGYDAAQIAPFVRSLRAHFDGAVALVVDDRRDVRELLDEHQVEVVHASAVDGWRPHAVMARFATFLDLMNRHPNALDVLITDVRDVVFQGDPFGAPLRGLEAFVEFEGGVLGDHAFNMKYLSLLVGDEIADTLASRSCICVGTVMGPRKDIARFCRTVLMLAAIPRSEIGGAFGADQAACNLAIHMDLVEAEVKPNFRRVATLGMTPGESLTFRDGLVVNPDGGVSPIVHQHDRHPHLDMAVHALWGQGMVHHERVQAKTSGDRFRKLRQSLARRLPELR